MKMGKNWLIKYKNLEKKFYKKMKKNLKNWPEVGFLRPSFIMEVYGNIGFSRLFLVWLNQIK